MKILIYNDHGACPCSVQSLMSALKQESLHHKYEIVYADRHIIKKNDWSKETKLLIFPGGRDIPYHRALKGDSNKNIVDFVENGGAFLGICAGAYYGCASIEFEKGNPLEVIDNRELKFFPGKGQGPAYGLGQFTYHGEGGSRIASLLLKDASASIFSSYYKGGCAFAGAEDCSEISTIAHYSDIENQPAAIVQCSVGKGRAILSGVHPEYSAYSPSIESSISEPLLSELKLIEPQRRKLFQEILARLLHIWSDAGAGKPSEVVEGSKIS